MVSLAPVVADALMFVDNQGIDTQLRKAGRRRETSLTTANNQNRRVMIFIRFCLLPLVEPVRTMEITQIRLSDRPVSVGCLFVPV